MWWPTGIVIAAGALLSAAALFPWAAQFRPEEPGSAHDPIALRAALRSQPTLSGLGAVVDLAALVIACVNFVMANSLSWGLAANWAFGVAVFAGVSICLARGWKHFLRQDWKVFRRSFFVTIATLLVAAVAMTPPTARMIQAG
jgi:hypothetical protein